MFQLSPEVKAALTYFITNGLKSLFALFGVEITGPVALIVAAAVAAFLFFAEAVIAGLSPELQQVVTAILGLLAAMGAHKTVKSIAEPR